MPALKQAIPNAGAGNAAPPSAGYYAVAAIPARYALERNDWAAAIALVPPKAPNAWADAVTHFARALGFAHLGKADEAKAEATRLAEIRETVRTTNDSYWTDQVDIQRLGAEAWATFAGGRRDEALTLMREAASREDATEKAAVTPGPIKPARELLGDMLLEMQRPADALAAYEATLTKEPNRFRSTYGAARAAQAAGQKQKATAHFAQLLAICRTTDATARPELVEARQATR